MFEYEGSLYSLDDIQAIVDDYNTKNDASYTVDDYVSMAGMVKVDDSAKTEGVDQQDVTTQSPVKPSEGLMQDMASFSENYSSGSSTEDNQNQMGEFKLYTPDTSQPVDQTTVFTPVITDHKFVEQIHNDEKYSGKVMSSVEKVMKSDNLKKINRRALADVETGDLQTDEILDYSDEKMVSQFNDAVIVDYMENDEDFALVRKEFEENFKPKAKEHAAQVAEKYGVIKEDGSFDYDSPNAERYLQEINDYYYSNFFKDENIANNIKKVNDQLGFYHDNNYSAYNVETNTPGWVSDLDNFVLFSPVLEPLGIDLVKTWGGLRSIVTGVEKGGLMDVDLQKVSYNHNKMLKAADEKGWSEDQPGFIDKKGIFQPYGKEYPTINPSPGLKQTTWKEAREQQEDMIKTQQAEWVKRYNSVINRMAVDMSYNKGTMNDIFEANGFAATVKEIGGMVSEQLPQMASAMISFGGIPAVQMAGEDYFSVISDRAKKKFGVNDDELTPAMLLDIVESDSSNKLGEGSMFVGTASGIAEYVGARSISKSALGINVLRGASRGTIASFARGAMQQNLRQTMKQAGTGIVNQGRASLGAGWDEFWTEVTQEVLTQAHVGKIDMNRVLEAGGMGFTVGMAMPTYGSIGAYTMNEMQSAFNMVRGKYDPKSSEAMYNYFAQNLRVKLDNNELTREEFDEQMNDLRFVQNANTAIPSSVREDKDLANDWVRAEVEFQKIKRKSEAKEELGEEYDMFSLRATSLHKQAIQALAKATSRKDVDQAKIKQLKRRLKKVKKYDLEGGLFAASALSHIQVFDKNFTRFSNIFNNTLNAAKKVNAGIKTVATYEEAAVIRLADQGIVYPGNKATDKQKQEYEQAVKDMVAQMDGTQGSITDGFFLSKDGSQYIITDAINDTDFNTDVAAHELQHHLWEKTLDNDQAIIDNLYFATRDALIDLSRSGKIKGDVKSVLDNLEKTYRLSDNKSKRDELLNIIGDSFTFEGDSQLAWNENLLQKVGRHINEWFGKTYNTEVNLDTGEDVIRWISGYKRNIVLGRGLGKGTVKGAEQGFKGKLTESKSPRYTAKYAESVMESKRTGPTEDQARVSREIQEIYDNREQYGEFWAFSILEYESSRGQNYFRNLVRSILKKHNYYERPNARSLEEDVIANSLYNWNQKKDTRREIGNDGVLGLIMSYDESKNDSLLAYINTYLGLNMTTQNGYGIIDKALQATSGRGFESSIDDVYDMSISEDSNGMGMGEALDFSEEVTFSKLRRILEFNEEQMNMVRKAVMDGMLALEEVSGPGTLAEMAMEQPVLFRNYFKNVFKEYLYKYLLEEVVGTKQGYREFLDKAYEWIPQIFDLRTLTNRKITPFYEVLRDPKTGKPLRYNYRESIELMLDDPKAGNPKVILKTPTYQEFKNWYNAVGMSQNMWFQRKKSIVEAMAETLGFDAAIEVLKNPTQKFFTARGKERSADPMDMMSEIAEASEKYKGSAVVARVAQVINRDPNVKFSNRMSPMDAADLITRDQEIQDLMERLVNPAIVQNMAMHAGVNTQTKADIRDYMSTIIEESIQQTLPTVLDPNSVKYLSEKAANFIMSLHNNKTRYNVEQDKKVADAYSYHAINVLTDIAKNKVFNKGLNDYLKASGYVSKGSTVYSTRLLNHIVTQEFFDVLEKYLENSTPYDLGNTNYDMISEVLQTKVAVENVLSIIDPGNYVNHVKFINKRIKKDYGITGDYQGYIARDIGQEKDYRSMTGEELDGDYGYKYGMYNSVDIGTSNELTLWATSTSSFRIDFEEKLPEFNPTVELSLAFSDAKQVSKSTVGYAQEVRKRLKPYNDILKNLVEQTRLLYQNNSINHNDVVNILEALDNKELLKLGMLPVAVQSDIDFDRFEIGENAHVVYRTGPVDDAFLENNNMEGHYFAELETYSNNYRVYSQGNVLRTEGRRNDRDKTEAYVVQIMNPFELNDKMDIFKAAASGLTPRVLIEQGYDGIIFNSPIASGADFLPGKEFVAFSSKQVTKLTNTDRKATIAINNEGIIPSTTHEYMISSIAEHILGSGSYSNKNPISPDVLGASIIANKKYKTKLEKLGYLNEMELSMIDEKSFNDVTPFSRFINMTRPSLPNTSKPGFQTSSNDFFLYDFSTGNFSKTLNLAKLNEHDRIQHVIADLKKLGEDLKESKRKKKSSEEKKGREEANKQKFKRKKKRLTAKTTEKLSSILSETREKVSSKMLTEEEVAKEQRLEEQEREAAALNKQMNDMIEELFGIKSESMIDAITADERSKKTTRREIITPAAEDFFGLLENYLVGKGKQGEKHLSFLYEYLIEPLMMANFNYDSERIRLLKSFRNIRETYKATFSFLKRTAVDFKRSDGVEMQYSGESVLRAYIFERLGHDTGLDPEVRKAFNAHIIKNPDLKTIALKVMLITKEHKYAEPKGDWWLGSIQEDILEALKKNSRRVYYDEFIRNSEVMFNEDNMNKLKYALGYKYTKALEGTLKRIKAGSNRTEQLSKTTRAMFDFMNGTAGVVMFGNVRSAVLQLISSTNYIDYGDNNLLAASKALANFPQFVSDFMYIMNSDFLLARRNGLQMDINESEIIDKTKTASNKFRAMLALILSKGYVFTKYGDSTAIALGGATYYRNKVNAYLRAYTGLDQKGVEKFIEELNNGRTLVKQNEQKANQISNKIKDIRTLINKAKKDILNGDASQKDLQKLQNDLYQAQQSLEAAKNDIDQAKNKISDDEQIVKDAEEKAFQQFMFKTDESQQSSRPERISEQQASIGGRFFLMFANTQMQYARIMKKDMIRFKNGIGDRKVLAARIVYYGMLQNIAFNMLQQTGFLVHLEDDEEEREKKIINMANGYFDSLLRGLGISGHMVSGVKNGIIEYLDNEKLIYAFSKMAPPLDAKARREKQMSYWIREAKKKHKRGFGLDELGPEYLEIAVQALSLANIPADRVRQLFQNYYNTFDFTADYDAHERVLMFLGWPDYQIPGAPDSRESREEVVKGDRRVSNKRVNKKKVGNKRINK